MLAGIGRGIGIRHPALPYDPVMQDFPALAAQVSAMWLTVAILAGGYARTRNRSAWTWFLLTAFTGPIAAFLLVVWPPRPTPEPSRSAATTSAETPR